MTDTYLAVTARDRQAGTFAALREYCIKAATYDAAYHRQADNIARRNTLTQAALAVLTAVTSLGTFGSLFSNRPETWARLLVFAVAALSTGLAAMRQSRHWGAESVHLRNNGSRWTEQHNKARILMARLCNDEPIHADDLQALAQADTDLVHSNRPIPNNLLDFMKSVKTIEFDKAYSHIT